MDELYRLIHTAPKVNEKNYETELTRKKAVIKLFKGYQKKFEKIKNLYDSYINEFNNDIAMTYTDSIEDVKIPVYEHKEGTISRNGNKYYCKINGVVISGNIGDVLPSHENYKIRKCKYESLKLCSRKHCPFYHNEEQRNFKENFWYSLIKNKKTLVEEIMIFKRKTCKEKREIIEDHNSFVMHNLLILILLSENE